MPIDLIKRPTKDKNSIKVMDLKNLQEYVDNQLKNIYDKLDEIVNYINSK